ncbi:hypothetical protein ALC60_09506 [Trachymyrmex zeteki]|uniref:DNA-directed DNA polymerase n=1 Tax=Mycetomoellerius zeteki TaxID=64791 RepID=A0A151WU80_9HYME|nr:hypothetical protein ALC60_09506 [Trachymyrmex zeteki]
MPIDVLQRYDSLKINTVLNGEFVAGDKRANKSIATRNYKLYQCIDLREWYMSRVVEPVLASLEEFQERDNGLPETRTRNISAIGTLTRKGVFPYEYIDCSEKLNELCLPPRESFYSSLTDNTVSESDYAHAVNVWQRFSIQTLGEYSDLYLKTNVLLLVGVFENFHNSCVASYGLDPAYYYTLPGFTWDAMLKHTGVKFELLTDIDMVMFVERGIRGGLSQCSNRYARANNKSMDRTTKQPNSRCADVARRLIRTFEDYTRCLNDAIEMTRRQSCIRSKLHEVYTISETKIALSPHDDKRYIVSVYTDTLPWGHYRCK